MFLTQYYITLEIFYVKNYAYVLFYIIKENNSIFFIVKIFLYVFRFINFSHIILSTFPFSNKYNRIFTIKLFKLRIIPSYWF